jgi:hypothetical protein
MRCTSSIYRIRSVKHQVELDRGHRSLGTDLLKDASQRGAWFDRLSFESRIGFPVRFGSLHVELGVDLLQRLRGATLCSLSPRSMMEVVAAA